MVSGGPRVVVLGVGNVLLKDEGVGVHIARALKEKLPQEEAVEVIDGGTSLEVVYLIGKADKLIIVDGVVGGGEPGTIYRFPPELIEEYAPISLHGLGVGDILRTLEYLGAKPQEAVIIGVEPEDMGSGLGLSPRLEAMVAKVLRVVLGEIGTVLEEKDACLRTEALV